MLDRHIQTILATRAVLYVLGCVGYFAVVLFCTRWMYAPQQSLTEHLREYLLATLEWLPAVMLLMPLVVLDMLLLSRRVVAPLQEIERSLDAIAQGQQPPQPESDDDAFHHGLVSSYQRCVARLRENAGAPPQQAADESAPPGADSAPVPEAGEEVEPEQLLDTTPQLAASS
jgi:AcrR family transcriptional regulator